MQELRKIWGASLDFDIVHTRTGWIVVALLATFCSTGLFAQSATHEQVENSIQRSVDYLLSAQSDSGYWGENGLELYTTVEVARALRLAQHAGYLPSDSTQNISLAISRAYESILGVVADDTERDALFLSLAKLSNRSAISLQNQLLNEQQFDGGWGLTFEHRSSVRDTALVADALFAFNPSAIDASRLVGAIDFLDGELKPESVGQSWAYGVGGRSKPVSTARVLIAMRLLGEALGSESAIYDGIHESLQYLELEVDPNGAEWDGVLTPQQWTDTKYDTVDYGTVLRGYAGLLQPRELDAMVHGLWLRQADSGEAAGGWTDSGELPAATDDVSILATAVVTQAFLALPSPEDQEPDLPDLAMSMFSLENVQDQDYVEFASFEFQSLGATVLPGDLPTGQSGVHVRFYNGDPRVVTYNADGQLQYAVPIGDLYTIDVPIQDFTLFEAGESTPVRVVDFQGGQSSLLGVVLDYDNAIGELDEFNNAAVTNLSGDNGAVSGVIDIAIKAGSIHVDHRDLVENPLVRLSATFWNRGANQITNKSVRVYYRTGEVGDGFTAQDVFDGTVDPMFLTDDSLIGYVDHTFGTDGDALDSLEEIHFEVEWLPNRSASRTVTAIVVPEPSQWNGSDADDLTNNMDQATFEFETGELSVTHTLAANNDLIFDLQYGDFCYSAAHGFAAYYRAGTGDDWIPIGNAPFGPSGAEVPCKFRIPRADVWQMPSGSYQALGEVWYVNPNTGQAQFIDDEIMPFMVPTLTSVASVSVSFYDADDGSGDLIIPQELVGTSFNVSDLQYMFATVYFETNDDSFNPSMTCRIVKVDSTGESFEDLSPPVFLDESQLSCSVSSDGGSSVCIADLSGFMNVSLVANQTYAVELELSGLPGNQTITRRHMFTLTGTEGYVLLEKQVENDGGDVNASNPVPATEGETVRVTVPIQKYDSN